MKFKGLKRYHSNGNQYIYHRATGRRLGVNLQEDDPKFVAAYLDAISDAKPEPKLELVKPNSVADICRRFITSKKFGELSKGYQDNLRRDSVRLCAEANGTMVRGSIRVDKTSPYRSAKGKTRTQPWKSATKTLELPFRVCRCEGGRFDRCDEQREG